MPAYQQHRESTSLNNRLVMVTVALIAFLGIVVRFVFFSLDRSLWQDEAMLASNFLDRTYLELLRPLDNNQHAPPLFLLIQKAIIEGFGQSEKILRIQSLVVGIASTCIFGLLAYRLLSRQAAILAMLLFAFSPTLIRYSAEVKPYSGDVLCATILAIATPICYPRRAPSARKMTFLLVAGVISVVYSFPSVFILAGIGSYLLWWAWLSKDYRTGWFVLAAGVCWLGCFLVYLWLLGRFSIDNNELTNFWDQAFLPFPPTSLWDGKVAFLLIVEVLRSPIGFNGWQLPVFLVVVALASGREATGHVISLTLTIIGILFAVAAAKFYPLSTRLVLFLSPFLCLIYGIGVERSIAGAKFRLLTFLLVCFAILSGQAISLRDQFTGDGPPGHGTRQALEKALSTRNKNEEVYIYHEIIPVFEYYVKLGAIPDSSVILGVDGVVDWQAYRQQLQDLDGPVWFVFGDVKDYRVDERELFLFELDERGEKTDEYKIGNAYLYRYTIK